MKKLTFKTNINCGGCLANVKPHLNKAVGENQWEVDLSSENRLLTIHNESISAKEVKAAVEEAGYKAESQEL